MGFHEVATNFTAADIFICCPLLHEWEASTAPGYTLLGYN